MRIGVFAFGFVFLVCCGQKPKLPSEGEARAAFEARRARLQSIQDAIQKSIDDAGLSKAAPTCADGDTACIETLKARHTQIAAAQKNLARVVSGSDIACAEVSVSTPKLGEELAFRIAACPPGRRGDAVDGDKSTKIDDYSVGRGVYYKADQVMRPGIAVQRESKKGDATASLVIYFFTDA